MKRVLTALLIVPFVAFASGSAFGAWTDLRLRPGAKIVYVSSP